MMGVWSGVWGILGVLFCMLGSDAETLTREKWNSIFSRDATEVYATDEEFQGALDTLWELLPSSYKAVFLVCGQNANPTITALLRKRVAASGDTDSDLVQFIGGSECYVATLHKEVAQELRSDKTSWPVVEIVPPLLKVPRLSSVMDFEQFVIMIGGGFDLDDHLPRWGEDLTQLVGPASMEKFSISPSEPALTHQDIVDSARKMARMHHLTEMPPEVLSTILNFLASQWEVTWVGPVETMSTKNYWSQWVVQTYSSNNRDVWAHGLDGTGEVIGIADTGMDTGHCMFYDPVAAVPFDRVSYSHRKLLMYITSSNNGEERDGGHGTHVAGSLAGESPDTDYSGLAPGAKLVFTDTSTNGEDIEVPVDLGDLFSTHYGLGARVDSHSWGSAPGPYAMAARSADAFVHSHPNFLPVFAAGNDGEKGASTITSPSLAKNVLAVGASMNAQTSFSPHYNSDLFRPENIAAFSSQGPTLDGRIKPDIVAPGQYVYSAKSDMGASNTCGIVGYAGTSMATPMVAAAATLVRQYFTKGYYPTGSPSYTRGMDPSAALLKAVLVNSGQRLSYYVDQFNHKHEMVYPGPVQGHGRVQLSESLPFLQRSSPNPTHYSSGRTYAAAAGGRGGGGGYGPGCGGESARVQAWDIHVRTGGETLLIVCGRPNPGVGGRGA